MINNRFIKTIILLINTIILLTVNINCQKTSKDKIEKAQGVKGTVTFQGKPIDWAFVYLYDNEDTSYKKQYAWISEATERGGKYTISPKPGKYFLVARKRWNYASTGPLRVGDYQMFYSKNPIIIEENKWIETNLELEEVKSELSVNAPKNTGIKGRIVFSSTLTSDIKSSQHNPTCLRCHDLKSKSVSDLMSGVYIYIYLNKDTELRGPSYYNLAKPESDGSFSLDLPPGKYYLTARKRINKEKFGLLNAGDYSVDYQKNPVDVKLNNYTATENILLVKIDPKKLKKVKLGETKALAKTIIRGTIKDKSGYPKEGVYAFVYQDSQMIGKPLYRSAVTGKDGSYEIFLSNGGNYYIGARDTFGGPLAPGDMIGAYSGTAERILHIEDAETKENIDIVVEEFY